MSEKAAVSTRQEKGREALVRLLESHGVNINHVEYAPIEVEPVGAAFAVHFRSVVFITPAEFAAAMQEPEEPS